jgi:FAD synthase
VYLVGFLFIVVIADARNHETECFHRPNYCLYKEGCYPFDQIKKHEMGGTCGMYGVGNNYIYIQLTMLYTVHIYTINNALYSTQSRIHVINIYHELKTNVFSNIKFINYIYYFQYTIYIYNM